MKTIKIFLIIYIFIMQVSTHSQDVPCIPESRRVNWQNAGLFEEPNGVANNVINITSYSGSDYEKIISAINDANLLPGVTLIYFPSGTYTIGNTITISNVKKTGIIFQGMGADETLLQFDGVDDEADCFQIIGQYSGNQKSIDSNIGKGNQWLYTNDGTSGIVVGDWIHFREPGFDDYYTGEDSWNGQNIPS